MHILSVKTNDTKLFSPHKIKPCAGFQSAYSVKSLPLANLAPLGVDTVSFKGRAPVAVYAFDKTGKHWRFDSQAEAADPEDGLNLNKRAIGRCVSGELKTTGGYTFCSADEIEIKDEDGNVLKDEKGVPLLAQKKIADIIKRFDAENKAVYEITTKKYTWFESQAAAAKALKIGKDGICNCLSGKLASTAGRTFVWAKDFETTDENGKVVPDKARLRDMVENFAGLDRTVYVYNELGDCFEFANPHIAARKLGLNYTGVAACLSGEQKTTGEYVIAFARDINKKDSLGRTITDKQKVKDLLKNFEHCPVYAIEKDGTYHWFKSQQDAINKLGLNKRSVQYCIQGAYAQTGGYTFARAYDIEKTRKDGSTYVSKWRLKEYLKLFDHRELYAVDKEGNFKWFESPAVASKELEIEPSRISACLLNKKRKTGDWTFVWARDLEQKLPGDKKRINETKIKNLKKRFLANDVYAIKRDGSSIEKFASRQAASAALEIDASGISKNTNGITKSAGGYRFVMAYDLETKDENGEMKLDTKKLRKAMKSIQRQASYFVRADGTYERFESDHTARKEGKAAVFNFALQRYKTNNGWCRISAPLVEEVTDDCKFKLDEAKLMEEFEKMRRQAVYLIDSKGNAQRYNNRLYSRLLTDAFIYDKDGRSCKLKPGYRCIPAIFVETKGEDGKYYFDSKKLDSEEARKHEIYTQKTLLYRQEGKKPPKAEEYGELTIADVALIKSSRGAFYQTASASGKGNPFDYLSLEAKYETNPSQI